MAFLLRVKDPCMVNSSLNRCGAVIAIKCSSSRPHRGDPPTCISILLATLAKPVMIYFILLLCITILIIYSYSAVGHDTRAADWRLHAWGRCDPNQLSPKSAIFSFATEPPVRVPKRFYFYTMNPPHTAVELLDVSAGTLRID